MRRSICAIFLSGAALSGPLARGTSAQPRRPATTNGPVQYQDANATPAERTQGFIRKIETGKPTTPLTRIGQYLFLGSDEPCFYTWRVAKW